MAINELGELEPPKFPDTPPQPIEGTFQNTRYRPASSLRASGTSAAELTFVMKGCGWFIMALGVTFSLIWIVVRKF